MANTQEGFRRLGIAIGSVAGTVYLLVALITVGSAAPSSLNPQWVAVLLIGTAVVWCAGWSLVRIARWVPDGGTATTYYDEYDRPIEALVHNSHNELVMSAVRSYDPMGRVTEERLTMHNMEALFPPDLRAKMTAAVIDIDDEAKAMLEERTQSVEFFYNDGDRKIRTVRREVDQEVVVVTTYNAHGDPEVEATTITPIGNGAEAAQSSHSETRYSYQYDQVGNWTEMTRHSSPEGAVISTTRRTLEYF